MLNKNQLIREVCVSGVKMVNNAVQNTVATQQTARGADTVCIVGRQTDRRVAVSE